ncbi:MAG: hypothetical protein ACRCVG_03155 [Methanobacteriaceae archaeon]
MVMNFLKSIFSSPDKVLVDKLVGLGSDVGGELSKTNYPKYVKKRIHENIISTWENGGSCEDIQQSFGFAKDIINILEGFINIGLMDEIMLQYKKDLVQPQNDQLTLETYELLNNTDRNENIMDILRLCFDDIYNNNDAIKKIKDIEYNLITNIKN